MIRRILRTLAALAAWANWVALLVVLSEVFESPTQSLNHVMSISIDSVEIMSRYINMPPRYVGVLQMPKKISRLKQEKQTMFEMLK